MRSCAKSSVHLRLLALLTLDAGSLRLLHRLGTLPFLATPGPSPSAWWLWLQRTAAQDAVASALRLIATGCAYWLLASTVLYLFARLGLSLFARPGRIHTLPRPIEWTTPAPVRRLVDQAVALSFVAGLAGTGAALASTGAPPPAPAPVVAVDGHTGVMVPAGARPLSPSVPAPPPRGPPVAPLAAPRGSSLHLVVPGDNLWSISAARLAEETASAGITVSNGRISPYWRAVIQTNRQALRSGNPDLIFPGETVSLPPST